MVDIETLSSASNAAIVSIGACVFDLDEGAEYASPDDAFIVGIHPEYYNLRCSAGYSFTDFDVSERTVKWWAEQSDEAKASLEINQMSNIIDAMDHFYVWLNEQGFEKDNNPSGPGASRIWAYPPSFDLVILRHAAAYCYGDSNDVPWHYRQETCARTHAWIFTDIAKAAHQGRKTNGLLAGLTKHRADHDAVRQARVVQFIEKYRA